MAPYPHLFKNAYYALSIHDMHFYKGEDTVPFFETVCIVVNCIFNVFRVFGCNDAALLYHYNLYVFDWSRILFTVQQKHCSASVYVLLNNWSHVAF